MNHDPNANLSRQCSKELSVARSSCNLLFTVQPPTTLPLVSTLGVSASPPTTYAVIPPIPPSDRDRYLTFAESGHHRTFMFAKNNTYIQLDGDIIQRFQLRYDMTDRLALTN